MNTKSPEQVCMAIRIHNKTLADKIEEQGYFITDEDLPKLVQYNRLVLLLVRCGNGRFLCSAQDVGHFIGMIENAQGLHTDYVRDVSLPV